MSKELEEKIRSIGRIQVKPNSPEYVGWDSVSEQMYVDLGFDLLGHGYTEEETYNLLNNAYRAIVTT